MRSDVFSPIRDRFAYSRKREKTVRPGSIKAKWAFRWSVRAQFYTRVAAQNANGQKLQDCFKQFETRRLEKGRYAEAYIAKSIRLAMDSGKSFAKAIAPWVDSSEVAMISSGEAAQNVANALQVLLDMGELRAKITGELKKGIFDPIIMMLSAIGMLLVVAFKVMPSFEKAMPKGSLTGIMAFLASLSAFVGSWKMIALTVFFIVATIMTIWSMSRWTGKWRLFAEKFFPWSAYRDLQGYLWATSFVSMLSTGGNMKDVQILKLQLEYSTPWLAERLRAIHRDIKSGASLPQALAAPRYFNKSFGFPSEEIIDMIDAMYGFNDFPLRMVAILVGWRDKIADKLAGLMRAVGGIIGMFSTGLMLMIALGAFSMSNSMSNSLEHTAYNAPRPSYVCASGKSKRCEHGKTVLAANFVKPKPHHPEVI